MPTQAWKLQMNAPLRVGSGRGIAEEALSYIPSDTLFAALVVTWQGLEDERATVANLQSAFADTPPLLLSSAFPYAGDVLLLPCPRLVLRPASTDLSIHKKLKRVAWVSASVFAQLVGGIAQEELDALWADASLVQDGTVWMTSAEKLQLKDLLIVDEDEEAHIWAGHVVPRVAVDRVHNASNLFHMERVHFAPNCGLWLMAQGQETWLTRVEKALTLLADSGIGGQRSRGNGQFTLCAGTVPAVLDGCATADAAVGADDTKQDKYCMLLSRLAPALPEMALLKAMRASYRLVTVGGYSGTPWERPLVRQSVRLLVEGSIIRDSGAGAPGQLLNVNPYWNVASGQMEIPPEHEGNPDLPRIDHPVYRYGYGMSVSVVLPSEEPTGARGSGR